MARRLIVANWKMDPQTLAEAKKIADATKKAAARARNLSVVICPPAIYLHELATRSRGPISFGVQDVFYEARGAFTGELSPVMAKNAAADYAIIGHSERRRLGETDAVIAKKVEAALDAGLTPILCVGEHERDAGGAYLRIVRAQLTEGLARISDAGVVKAVVAYEPVWAIGRDASQSIQPADLHEMVIFIKKVLAERLGRGRALRITILYGGAVEKDNVLSLARGGDIGGFLVGHASLDMAHFPLLIKVAAVK